MNNSVESSPSSDDMSRLLLTHLGVTCALGSDKKLILEKLLAGDQSGLVQRTGFLPDQSVYVGEVQAALDPVPAHCEYWKCRNNELLYHAYQQIEPEIQGLLQRVEPHRIGIILGTSTTGVSDAETAIATYDKSGEWADGYHYGKQEMSCPSLFLKLLLGTTGPAYSVSTACSSSGKAFASAQRLLRSGMCDAVLVGGVDTLCKLTLNGFKALESISPLKCAPFTRDRKGITIGEAAALFILEPEVLGLEASGSEVELRGVGESSDAHHISAPHPEGEGAARAISAALRQAGLEAAAVDYINLHGTATPLNDAMESKAVAATLGDQVKCSSTKGTTGHTLGAAGALEAAFCWLLLSEFNQGEMLPPNAAEGELDDALPALNWVQQGDVFRPLQPGVNERVLLSNSFAFGGSNVCVALSRKISP